MSTAFTWLAFCGIVAMALPLGVAAAQVATTTDAEHRARTFIAEHEANIRPLEIAVNRAWWKANTTGKDEDFAAKEEAQNQLDRALSDTKRFAELKALRDGKLADPLVARQIAVLYLGYLEKQVPPELLRQDHGQGQRHRKGVQRVSRQGGRATS